MWFILSILYAILFTPTMSLSSSLTFSHLPDRQKQFPLVRLWGTVGWVLASWIFPILWLQTDIGLTLKPPFFVGAELQNATARLGDGLRISAIMSILYALYSLTLPHTPPKKDVSDKLAFAKAFRLLKERPLLVLFFATLFLSMVHQAYYIQASPYLSAIGVRDTDIMPAMSIGQMGEVIVMAMLGIMLTRLSFRSVIFIGGMAAFLRYLIFGTLGLPIPVIIAAQGLHGFCYACFFAASYIYVDRRVPSDVRHSAQILFSITAVSLGAFLGGLLSGALDTCFAPAGAVEKFAGIWYSLSLIALIASLLFYWLFPADTVETETCS